MLARIRKAQDNEGGFTLIELLVVMIIIGILAAIAIPAFLNQKKKAAESSAKSDATNIARDIAAYFVDGKPAAMSMPTTANTTNSSITATVTADGETTNVKVGANNTASLTYDAVAGTYCVAVDPAQADAKTWSANQDGLYKNATCA